MNDYVTYRDGNAPPNLTSTVGSMSSGAVNAASPQMKGITVENFHLPPTGLTEQQHTQALTQLQQYLSTQQASFLGYQVNQQMDYADDLRQFLNCHINNVGDPFTSGNLTLNTKGMERAVLDYYATLWHAQLPHNPFDGESYWGYVVSMGRTEGNLYGLWNARDYLAGKPPFQATQKLDFVHFHV